MALRDIRDEMHLAELVERLEASHPEKVAGYEARHPEAMEAVAEAPEADDSDLDCDEDLLDDLRDDLLSLLRI